ncbi:MAG TPA: NfeD family protein [Bacillota bacterium]|nr:NfeD family protein [Bacillota bacterium]
MEALSFITDMELISALCLFFGLALVIFEMFIPGFGLPGTLGLILLIFGVVQTAQDMMQVLILTGAILAILAIALMIVLRSASKGRLAKTLILNNSFKKEDGYNGTEDLTDFLGKSGTALTVLRPAGTADVDGVKLDVVTEAEFLPKGTKVKVVKVEGRRVVVRGFNV